MENKLKFMISSLTSNCSETAFYVDLFLLELSNTLSLGTGLSNIVTTAIFQCVAQCLLENMPNNGMRYWQKFGLRKLMY